MFPNVSAPVVSCFGDFTQGYAVPSTGAWANYASTSGATPFMAAVHARLVQYAGAPFDFMNFALACPEAFNDIATGSNGAYTAGVGRDMVTGIGSPNGPAMLSALDAYLNRNIIIDGSSS
jgi:kumamolisin